MKNVGQSMKHEVVSISVLATISEAAAIFVEEHIGTLPVIAEDGNLAGILHIRDLLDLVMPSFVRLMADFDFVLEDFSIFETFAAIIGGCFATSKLYYGSPLCQSKLVAVY